MQIPESRTIPGLLDEMAARYPDAEFVIDGDRRYGYARFRDEARALAKGLHALGVRKDSKVAILMGNQVEWLLADFAITMLGGIMVSINTWCTPRELEYLLNHSDTEILITVDRYLKADYPAMLRGIGHPGPKLPKLKKVICAGAAIPADMIRFDALAGLGGDVSDAALDAAQAGVRPEDVAYLLYTSGSTSTPKGVQIQHVGLIENMWNIGERQHLEPGERLWLAVSLYWGLGCENGLFTLMTHGGCLVLQDRFDAGEALRLIEAERCSVIYATPNMTLAMLEHPERARRDLSSLRTGVTIGSPEQIQFAVELGATEICNIYGSTESYGNCIVCDGRLPLERRLVSVGTPLPGFDFRIVDPDTGALKPAGEAGEIRLKGYVTIGYYKDADKNADAFDAEGYFKTGDLAYQDADGFVYFRGRIKEMIKTGGINVAPAEVEEVLMMHDAVELAYVIGIPDAERDEIIGAVIVPAAGAAVSEATLRGFAREQLAAYKAPRAYRFVAADALPLTTTGKLQKNRLVDFFPAEAETKQA